MPTNEEIILAEIAKHSGGSVLGIPPTITPPPSPALPLYSRPLINNNSRPLTKQIYDFSNNGLKEFINFGPWNQQSGVFSEQPLTAYGATLTVPSSTNLVQILQVDPFTGKAASTLSVAASTGVVTVTNAQNITVDNLPFNLAKEDNINMAVYGGANGTFAPITFEYAFDSTRYIYKLLLNLVLVVNVPTYTSGNYNFGTFTMTIKNKTTNQDIIDPVSFNLGALFNVINATTLTSITNGISVAVLRGEKIINGLKLPKIVFGQPIVISISWTKTSGGGTAYYGMVTDSFPDSLANNTKRWYPIGMQVHSYPTLDHIDNLKNDPLYSSTYDYEGVQLGG